MTDRDQRPLADDMATHVDQARLARQWSAVSSGLERRPRKRYFLAALVPAALVAVALIALLVVKPWRAAPAGDGAAVARVPDALVLPDGSHLTLSSGAELVLESATRERVHVILGAGTIELDVTHVEGRPFVVTAGGHDVTVLGTAFSVKLAEVDGKRTLSVGVSRGRVRVTGPSGEHVLDAGQAWSARVDAPASTSATTALPAAPPAAVTGAPADTTADTAVAAAGVAPGGSTEPALAALDPSSRVAPAAPATPAAPAAPVEGPRELLARATEARSAGRPRDAALALDTLRKRHRSDPRAGLAAFELGRVRMDALGDPAGAAEAFADAIAIAPSAPFREDAEARRVEALDALPDRARCERARDAYLTRYPAGLHAKQIAQRCKRP